MVVSSEIFSSLEIIHIQGNKMENGQILFYLLVLYEAC